MAATADLNGATKGQLEAWQEHAQFDTGTYKRKKPRILDVVTGKMITLDIRRLPVSSRTQKVHPLLWSARLNSQPLHGAARFCLSMNIRKHGCFGVTAKAFDGGIRSP